MPPKAAGEAVGDLAREIARRAGEIQLRRLSAPHEIREKAPKDIVTEVDLLCEDYLVSAINEHSPEDAILSEERGGDVSESGRTWLLDPLDGTANYSKGVPLFCCCVSVLERGIVTHAAVAIPCLGDLYYASIGGGAWLDHSGVTSPLRVGRITKLEDAFIGADSRFGGPHDNGRYRPLDRLHRSGWQVRSIGSAGVRGAWVAAGHLDVSAGETNSAWDYAPTALLVAEAGGSVTDLDGAPWTLTSGGMLATNGLLHGEALEVLAGQTSGPGDAGVRDAGSRRAGGQ